MEGVTKNADILPRQFGEGSDGENISLFAGGTVPSTKKCIGTTINWGDFGDGNMMKYGIFWGERSHITTSTGTGTNLNRRLSELPTVWWEMDGTVFLEGDSIESLNFIRLQVWIEKLHGNLSWKEFYMETALSRGYYTYGRCVLKIPPFFTAY